MGLTGSAARFNPCVLMKKSGVVAMSEYEWPEPTALTSDPDESARANTVVIDWLSAGHSVTEDKTQTTAAPPGSPVDSSRFVADRFDPVPIHRRQARWGPPHSSCQAT